MKYTPIRYTNGDAQTHTLLTHTLATHFSKNICTKFRCPCYKASEIEDYRKHLQPLNIIITMSDFIARKLNIKKKNMVCTHKRILNSQCNFFFKN